MGVPWSSVQPEIPLRMSMRWCCRGLVWEKPAAVLSLFGEMAKVKEVKRGVGKGKGEYGEEVKVEHGMKEDDGRKRMMYGAVKMGNRLAR